MAHVAAPGVPPRSAQPDPSSVTAREARVQAAARVELTRAGARRGGALQSSIPGTLGVLGTLVIWELVVRVFAIPAFLMPPPTTIFEELLRVWPLLVDHTLITLWEVVAGFAASLLVGVPLAVLIAYFKPFERLVYPLLVSAQTIPKAALAPVFIVWFGFGLTPKVIIAFLIAFFPVVISTVVGLRSIAPEMLYLVQSMGATPWQTFWKIRIPTALPSMFGGFKVAIGLAVVGAIVGEFVGADKGLGYIIQVASGNLNTKLLFASIFLLSFVGVVLFWIVDLVEKRLLRWHVSTRVEQMQTSM